MSTRPSFDDYFMSIARVVATRATCPRKQVGSVIVVDRQIAATGYNGALPGLPHCTDVGCMLDNFHCVRVNHSECNAIAQAAKHGVRLDGAAIYVTASPCWPCFRMIAASGIKRIIFGEFYRDMRVFSFSLDMGIDLVDMSKVPTYKSEHPDDPPPETPRVPVLPTT